MPISPIGQTYGGASAPPAAPSGELDRNAFLQLLVTQLANQDPLSPQAGHEFAAQLAQFSSVEQLSSIAQTLTGHSHQLAALAAGLDAATVQQGELGAVLANRADLASAAGLVGQTVEAEGNKLVWTGQKPAQFGYALDEPAASVRVSVRDQSGRTVRTIELGHAGAGPHGATWDGLGDDGQPLPPGTYTFAVDARDPAGEALDATTTIRGRVDRITIDDDGVRLWIGELAVPLADLRGLIAP